ncbi:MAG: NAD-dependent epimerase/dehydratase family protein [Bdellovibrionales bacterium]|nr:NAD-dependent epimerase/dehydratase family protein [Bdellovibrionales bacterium]
MRCLVTGAAGFIGSTLCERLMDEGHEVVGIDSFVDYYPREVKERNLLALRQSDRFRFIEADLVECQLDSLVEGIEWIFHQAAQAGVRASWGDYFASYVHNNVFATQKLLEALRKSDSVKKIVFASSSSIYGNAEISPTSEDAIPAPVSPYGVTKLASEHLMSLYAVEAGLPTVSLRYFTVFGPRQRPDMAFNRFIRAAIKQDEITVYGDGEQSRDFTYVGDVVEANLLAAKLGNSGQVFNIGGGPHASVNQVLSILEQKLGKLSVNRVKRQIGDARHTFADISLAEKFLGFKPQVNLEHGLENEIEWLERELQA